LEQKLLITSRFLPEGGGEGRETLSFIHSDDVITEKKQLPEVFLEVTKYILYVRTCFLKTLYYNFVIRVNLILVLQQTP
jgi:hypothetical protein